MIAKCFEDLVIQEIGLKVAATENSTSVVDELFDLLLAPCIAVDHSKRLNTVSQGGKGFAQMHLVADNIVRITDREIADIGIFG